MQKTPGTIPKVKTLVTISIILIALISLLAIVLTSNGAKHPQRKVLAQTAVVSTKAAQQATASSTPSPDPSPDPSPVLTGFCINVPILMYHHIQPQTVAKQMGQTNLTVDSGTFDQQMAYLSSSGYRTITMDELAGALKNHQKLGKVVVVTLDDGYQDAYTYALPIFQKYHITANLFIPTGLMNNPDYMTWDQLKQMVSNGAVAYDHTWSHANLGAASADKLKFEVMTSKQQLESNLGKTVNIFAYPYGSETPSVINFLTANGFVAAASTIPGSTQCDSFIMTLHRTRIGNSSLRAYGL